MGRQLDWWVEDKFEGEKPDWVKSYQEKRAIIAEKMRERKDTIHQGRFRSENNRFCALGLVFDTLSKMYPDRFEWRNSRENEFGDIETFLPEAFCYDQHGNKTHTTFLSIESWLGIDDATTQVIILKNDRESNPKPSWGEMADFLMSSPYTKQPELFSWDSKE